ncbi:hypothetical protein [Devosia sp. MC1541]|uniref:hypothetical protein n=1 Tax=Devosia sp. MC1541 TaxID=2725264 RepID=UPI00145DD760|nr:hypothetical protein [Devosia sp. MC1541]
MEAPFSTLADLPHIDSSQLAGRTVYLVPVWSGSAWEIWLPVEEGKLVKVSIVDIIRSHYLAKEAVKADDVHIPMLEFMWQHMSWGPIAKVTSNIAQDFHQMATSAAKLEHYYQARDTIGQDLIATFVNSEIEHLLVVARSLFDLLQESMALFWKNYVRLLDPVAEKGRKERPMQSSFRTVILEGNNLRTAAEIARRYSLPATTAEMYAKHAPFFMKVRGARDQVVHNGTTPDSVFTTERGFCVDPKAPYFRDFQWTKEHHYNESIVTLVPWVAWLVGGTLEACSDILFSLSGQVQFPSAMSPAHHLFLRDPANPALLRLAEAAQGPHHWWHEAPAAPLETPSPAIAAITEQS